jgi:hypothetical protein
LHIKGRAGFIIRELRYNVAAFPKLVPRDRVQWQRSES